MDFNSLIKKNGTLAVLFGSPDCNVCTKIKAPLFEMLNELYPNIKTEYIDTKKEIELSAQLQIFSLPVFIFYISGREVFRKVRLFGIEEICREIERPYNLYYK